MGRSDGGSWPFPTGCLAVRTNALSRQQWPFPTRRYRGFNTTPYSADSKQRLMRWRRTFPITGDGVSIWAASFRVLAVADGGVPSPVHIDEKGGKMASWLSAPTRAPDKCVMEVGVWVCGKDSTPEIISALSKLVSKGKNCV
jgi:hypothetical protein